MAKELKRINTALGRFSNSTVTNGDEGYKNDSIADYTVKKKVEGVYRTKRILYYVCFTAAIILLFTVFFLLDLGPMLIICGFGVFLALLIIKFFTWKYFDIQYSYAIENAEFFATEIYGEKADKLLIRIKIKSIISVVPFDVSINNDKNYSSSLFIASSPSSPDLYRITYDDGKGGEAVVYLDACSKTLKAFRYYCGDRVEIKQTTR